jgi:hypothetical protein
MTRRKGKKRDLPPGIEDRGPFKISGTFDPRMGDHTIPSADRVALDVAHQVAQDLNAGHPIIVKIGKWMLEFKSEERNLIPLDPTSAEWGSAQRGRKRG